VLEEHRGELAGKLDDPPRLIRLQRLPAALAVDL
jgi:hypothetical protein